MELFEVVADLILENKTITMLILVLCLLYYHYTSTFTFFKERGIPYKTPTIFFGNISPRVLMKTSFHEFNLKLYRDFDGERFAGYFEGRCPVLIIRDPELLKAILIRDFDHFIDRVRLTPNEPNCINRFIMNMKGAEWRTVRGILTPCFSSARMRAMVPIIDECIRNMIKRIDAKIKDNPEIEMKNIMTRITLETICTCALGIECEAVNGKEPHFIKFSRISGLMQVYNLLVLLLMSDAAKHLKLSFWNLKVIRELRKILAAVKKIRMTDLASRRKDLLQMLLDTSDKEKEEFAKNPSKQLYLDDDTIDAQALQFVVAGFETTSSVLAFTTYLLAIHPEVQTKLREEINEVAQCYDGEINYDSIGPMHYLEAVLFESMRIHPALALIDRECVKEYTIPGSNVTLMPGQRLIVPVIGLHMDAKYFPEPEKFKPERFINEEKGNIPSQVYLPFGAGPRNCIGLRFATIESKLTIARLIMKFELAPGRKTQVPIRLARNGVALQSERGVWVKISPVSSK